MDQAVSTSISHACTKKDCFYCYWLRYNEERLNGKEEIQSGSDTRFYRGSASVQKESITVCRTGIYNELPTEKG